MKKLLLMVMIGLMGSMAFAYNFNATPPNAMTIFRTTLTTAETVYSVTLTNEAAVQYDLIARGGDIRWQNTTSTVESNYKTIKQDISDYSPMYVTIPGSTVWYFISSTGVVTIEGQLWHLRSI